MTRRPRRSSVRTVTRLFLQPFAQGHQRSNLEDVVSDQPSGSSTTPYLSGKDIALLFQVGNPLYQSPIVQHPVVNPVVRPGQGLHQTLDGLLELLKMFNTLGVLRREDPLGLLDLLR